ncbi:hypothetical protein HC256_010073 [Beauveria bassiana]|nr:hypothetical protein HC256_010073 [Beauveria bassiana]
MQQQRTTHVIRYFAIFYILRFHPESPLTCCETEPGALSMGAILSGISLLYKQVPRRLSTLQRRMVKRGAVRREKPSWSSPKPKPQIILPPHLQEKQTHQPTRFFVSQLHRTSPAKNGADLRGTGSGSRVSRGLLGGLLGLGGGGGLVLLGGIGAGLGLGRVRRGPQGEVVTEKLHDQGAVTVRLLRQ